MKKCTYCGKAYADDATSCEIDSQPLVSIPVPLPASSPPEIDPITYAPNQLIAGSLCLLGIGAVMLAFFFYEAHHERIIYLKEFLAAGMLILFSFAGIIKVFQSMLSRNRVPKESPLKKGDLLEKRCSYCGREEENEAVTCLGCGTEFDAK